jgi:hypothetical protein
MTLNDIRRWSVERLVEEFANSCKAQGEALLGGDVNTHNRHYRDMAAIRDELKSRPGDQRRALLALYESDNPYIRLQAARATYALAPDAARAVIEEVANSKNYPFAGHAGMALWAIDEGISKPS